MISTMQKMQRESHNSVTKMVFNDAECHRIGQSLDEQIQSRAVHLIIRKSQYVLVFVNIKAQKDCI